MNRDEIREWLTGRGISEATAEQMIRRAVTRGDSGDGTAYGVFITWDGQGFNPYVSGPAEEANPDSDFAAVTITFKVTPGQRAAYAAEYGVNAGVFGDLAGHLQAAVSDAVASNYLITSFTSYSVSQPA